MTTVSQLRRDRENGSLARQRVVGPALVMVLGVGSLVLLGLGMSTSTYDVWGGFWVAPALLLATIPIANHAARLEDDRRVGRIIMIAAFVKVVVGSAARGLALTIAYGGGGDSARYDEAGKVLAPALRSLDYSDLGKVSATRFIEVLTGQVYAVIGPTEFGGFVVFSWFGFLGLYFFYRAFCVAMPDGDRRMYRLLIFFFPTMWFWPSSIGKEAWMIMVLGAAAYGFALAMAGRWRGLFLAGLGLWGATIVRPHMTLILLVALGAGTAFRAFNQRRPSGDGRGGRVAAWAFLVVVVVGAIAGAAEFERRFGLSDLSVDSAESVLDEATGRTSQGGSEFTAVSPNNPIGYGIGFVTVLFRPFPVEARNATALLSSLEGLALISICLLAFRSIRALPGEVFRSHYVAAATVYVFTFAYAFSSIENFGLLARQRSQVLPLIFVLLTVTPILRSSKGGRTDEGASEPSGLGDDVAVADHRVE